MTINEIATNLYMLPVKLRFCHHLTTSGFHHTRIGDAYDKLNDLSDEIVEKLMGYMSKRFTDVTLIPISGYKETYPTKVCNEIIMFSSSLCEFAKENGYLDIENLAQSYSGVAAHLKGFLIDN